MSSRSNHQRLVALEKQMDAAAADFDFEKAAALRDEIARLRGEYGDATEVVGEDGETVKVVVGQAPPGQIGLGSNAPLRQPPKGWVKPKKPPTLTKNHKPRGGR
ncbi:UvrB/UvrC motif-containing protein [Devosia sp. MSA67]|uniref:UvrB/UvrC motif-containing protein n=1 Tax=Devosia sediminis TaxID=2798801 RepID=A0A934J0N8_9HYPH|nr:UvrB/UvrC motif-containing protein [Devosia sediminis]MBJ3786761.1 UvrB/UvrC motif-containing protein [Devosia sediminis]